MNYDIKKIKSILLVILMICILIVGGYGTYNIIIKYF